MIPANRGCSDDELAAHEADVASFLAKAARDNPAKVAELEREYPVLTEDQLARRRGPEVELTPIITDRSVISSTRSGTPHIGDVSVKPIDTASPAAVQRRAEAAISLAIAHECGLTRTELECLRLQRQGQTYASIAEALKCTPGNVGRRLSDARHKLARHDHLGVRAAA